MDDLLSERIRIRLCKGAYKEPPEIAFPKKADVDANYLKLARTLLKSGVYHGIATHDERIIAEIKQFAQAENIPASAYEFQMLYGVRRDLQQQLVRKAMDCGCIFRLGRSGIRTSCGGWPSGRRTCSLSPGRCSGIRSGQLPDCR